MILEEILREDPDQFLFFSYSNDDLNTFKMFADAYEHSRRNEICSQSNNSTQRLTNFIQRVYGTPVVSMIFFLHTPFIL